MTRDLGQAGSRKCVNITPDGETVQNCAYRGSEQIRSKWGALFVRATESEPLKSRKLMSLPTTRHLLALQGPPSQAGVKTGSSLVLSSPEIDIRLLASGATPRDTFVPLPWFIAQRPISISCVTQTGGRERKRGLSRGRHIPSICTFSTDSRRRTIVNGSD